MSKISNTIYIRYVELLPTLPLDKQLHFASRLYLWSGDEDCRKILDSLLPQVQRGKTNDALVQSIYTGEIFPISTSSHMIAGSLRRPFLERYPLLRPAAFTLYWAHLLEALYGLDLRYAVFNQLPAADLEHLYDSLLADQEAVAMLSTFAVNFMYLYQEYILGNKQSDLASYMHTVATLRVYNQADPTQQQLLAYLLSHSVINASGFYTHAIPDPQRAVYLELLTLFERLVRTSPELRLDNMFEFLVCAKLLGYTTDLETTIQERAAAAQSVEGGFIRSESGSGDLASAEHRSVLYVMADRLPQPNLVNRADTSETDRS